MEKLALTIPRHVARHRAFFVTIAVFGFWGVTIVAATRPGQRIQQRIAQILVNAPYCDELEPTIIGTPGDDILHGTDGPDVIVGLDGNDTLHGGTGADRLCGNNGDDILHGDGGGDRLIGNAGNDTLDGGGGDDALHGGEGNDTLNGGRGDDELFGSGGDDTLDGGGHALRDSCYGGAHVVGDTMVNC
jgi:Ca2+-binding RTX toxin-like protein